MMVDEDDEKQNGEWWIQDGELRIDDGEQMIEDGGFTSMMQNG